MLVEFPRLVAGEAVRSALAPVISLGLTPVLAHPERYSSCSVESVRRWRALGAVMQVDATTLLSPRPRGERARRLVEAGLADILAADNHGDSRMLLSAWQMLEEHGGRTQAHLLVSRNPAAILQDDLTEEVPPLPLKASLLERLRRLWAPTDE
jgi:protein-tyrosine phosphatase